MYDSGPFFFYKRGAIASRTISLGGVEAQGAGEYSSWLPCIFCARFTIAAGHSPLIVATVLFLLPLCRGTLRDSIVRKASGLDLSVLVMMVIKKNLPRKNMSYQY